MKQTHWQEIIADLRGPGQLKLREIAEGVECTISTVSDLASGRSREASYRVGSGLTELHRKIMKRTRRTN